LQSGLDVREAGLGLVLIVVIILALTVIVYALALWVRLPKAQVEENIEDTKAEAAEEEKELGASPA